LANLGFLYLFLIVWVALYYQSVGIEWSLQAKRLDLNFMGIKILPEQVQLADPVLIVILVPLFQYIIYPTIGRFFRVTALGKIGVGLVFMIGAYVIMWYLQTQIDVGAKPNVSGQLLAYVFVATSEVLVSVTGFEFSYTQAPNKLKSFVMALWLTAIALGNQFAAIINLLIATLDQYQISILKGANYYAFYVLLMFFVFIIFVGFTKRYRGQTFLQGSA
jgi:POT family proton-dependent oligopeptide transporter